MSITHEFVSSVPDGTNTNLARPSNWNAPHVLRAETADPVSPAQGEWWILLTGTTPSRVAAIKVHDGGVTYTIASITY